MKRDPIGNWRRLGSPGWPPHDVKVEALLEIAERFSLSTLVETGTYAGDMIMCVAHCFERYYSIELCEGSYRENVDRYGKLENLELIHGDSATVLAARAEEFLSRGPALFWLDAHGPADSALLRELDVLAKIDIGGSAILMDDVRLMSWMRDGWPDLSDVRRAIKKAWPDRAVTVEDDMIKVTP